MWAVDAEDSAPVVPLGVGELLAEAERERTRLAAELEDARARGRVAVSRRVARELDARAELEALVLSAEAQLRRIEDEHRWALEALQRAAEAETTGILAAAQAEAGSIRLTGASLTGLVEAHTRAQAPS